jgi:hypothetical protein
MTLLALVDSLHHIIGLGLGDTSPALAYDDVVAEERFCWQALVWVIETPGGRMGGL